MHRPSAAVLCRSCFGARRAKCCSSAPTTCPSTSDRSERLRQQGPTDLWRPCTPSGGPASVVLGYAFCECAPSGPRRQTTTWGTWTPDPSPFPIGATSESRRMRRGFRRGLAFGVAYGVMAALFAEAVRPRGGSTVLLDWDEVARLAMSRLRDQRMSSERLAEAAATYNRFAAGVRAPLLETVGGPPESLILPDFEALDRAGWLELNIGILRRVMEPLAAVTQVPDSWLAITGRAGLSRYVSLMLEFLSRRVLGQFDPQLMGKEPIRAALYLVEPNVVTWQGEAKLNGADLRRWLILHEMTHAWQFSGHPWLRDHMDGQIEELIELAR